MTRPVPILVALARRQATQWRRALAFLAPLVFLALAASVATHLLIGGLWP
jgi:hypothetical protein